LSPTLALTTTFLIDTSCGTFEDDKSKSNELVVTMFGCNLIDLPKIENIGDGIYLYNVDTELWKSKLKSN
jgi:hypothetical protein